MNSKEKAKELNDKYYEYVADGGHPEYLAKQCALISVDEIIKLIESKCFNKQFFIKVKQEIEKL